MASRGSEQKVIAGEGAIAAGVKWLRDLKKFGFGTMTHPEIERWIARNLLFDRMRRMLPAELRNLANTVLPLYSALYELGRRQLPMVRSDCPALGIRDVISNTSARESILYVEDWSTLMHAAERVSEAQKLAAALSAWTDAICMSSDWFRGATLINLCIWCKGGVDQEKVTWSYPGGSLMRLQGNHQLGGGDMKRLHGWSVLDRVVPVPVVKPYNPSTQTREDHRADFQIGLSRYYDAQEEHFARAGFKKSAPKRRRKGQTRWEHFEWFIKYQMQAKAASQIAGSHTHRTEEKLDESSISKAVREIARIVEVTLRQDVADHPQKLKRKNPKS